MRDKKYGLGYLPDPGDLRDIPMSLVLPVIPIPKSVDYTKEMSPVEDQDGEGVCVAFACGDAMKEYQEKKERKQHINLSVRYLYQKCKEIDGIPDQEGTYIRVAMKILRKKGIPPEECWPFVPHNIGKPCADADSKAYPYRIKAFARLKNILEMKRSLIVNGPFVAGVKVYDSFLSEDVARIGIVPVPAPEETLQGGHAICIVGYDDEKQLFKFKNSWSKNWGDNGYGYLSYEYIEKYCIDAWSATDLIEDPEKIVKEREF